MRRPLAPWLLPQILAFLTHIGTPEKHCTQNSGIFLNEPTLPRRKHGSAIVRTTGLNYVAPDSDQPIHHGLLIDLTKLVILVKESFGQSEKRWYS